MPNCFEDVLFHLHNVEDMLNDELKPNVGENQCHFWIQRIRFVLNQLKNGDNKIVVDQCNSCTM